MNLSRFEPGRPSLEVASETLLSGIAKEPLPQFVIRDIHLDSRKVKPGTLFVALGGHRERVSLHGAPLLATPRGNDHSPICKNKNQTKKLCKTRFSFLSTALPPWFSGLQ